MDRYHSIFGRRIPTTERAYLVAKFLFFIRTATGRCIAAEPISTVARLDRQTDRQTDNESFALTCMFFYWMITRPAIPPSGAKRLEAVFAPSRLLVIAGHALGFSSTSPDSWYLCSALFVCRPLIPSFWNVRSFDARKPCRSRRFDSIRFSPNQSNCSAAGWDKIGQRVKEKIQGPSTLLHSSLANISQVNIQA